MIRITGRSWRAITAASVAEMGKELERAEATEGAKLAIWLHFGLRVVKAKLVNNMEVECWHCGAAVKCSGNATNLAADMAKERGYED